MRHILAFIWKHSFFFLFLTLELIALILIANRSFYHRSVFSNANDRFTGSILTSWSGITSYFSLKQENKLLSAENARLMQLLTKSQVSNDTASEYVNDTLYKQQYTYTPAQVINNSASRRDNYIMLNKGRRMGIKPDMAVINPQGIVGTVVSVSENFSWVMSLLNKHSRISARIERINQMGTVIWEGGNPATGTLVDIPAHVKVLPGDSITTSGFSNIFPEGVLIGIVEEITVNKGAHFYTIYFRFSADLNSLRHVYVVGNLFREEQTELSKKIINGEVPR